MVAKDLIAAGRIGKGVDAVEIYSDIAAPGYDVASAGDGAADDVVVGVVEINPEIGIPESACAGRIGADVVAKDVIIMGKTVEIQTGVAVA